MYGRVEGYADVPDDPTPATIQAYPDPAHKITFIRRTLWPHKMAMQNTYLETASCDVIFRPDCDEFIDDLPALAEAMRRQELPAARLRWQHYYGGTTHLIEGGRFDVWPMRAFLRLPGYRFRRHFDELVDDRGRSLSSANAPRVDVLLHHYGYAKPLAEIQAKHLYYHLRGDAPHAHRDLFRNGLPASLGEGTRVVPFDPRRHASPKPRSLAVQLTELK